MSPVRTWMQQGAIPAAPAVVLLINVLAIVVVVVVLMPKMGRHEELFFMMFAELIPLGLTMIVCMFERARKAAIIASIVLIVSATGFSAYNGLEGPYDAPEVENRKKSYADSFKD